jgi:hypothetical protein
MGLSTKSRNKLPASKFALPDERKYPVDTRARAANAKARASGAENAGRISKEVERRIDAKADRVLGRKGK